MSLLTFCNESSPGNTYWANGGGGAGSTLQSPATILPAVDGSISVTGVAPTGNATIGIQSVAGNATVYVQAGSYQYGMTANSNDQFKLTTDTNSTFFQYNAGNHFMTLGDGLAGGVGVNQLLTVGNNAVTATNTLVMGPTADNVSEILNTTQNTGNLIIGCSLANPACIYVRDTGAAGSASVDITSGIASGALSLAGEDSAHFCHVAPNFPAAGLQIGSSSVYPNVIQVTDTGVTMSKQLSVTSPLTINYAPITLTTSPAAGTYDVDCTPLGTGINMVYGYSTVPTAADRAAMFSVIIFQSVGNAILGGGNAQAPGLWVTAPSATSANSLTITLASSTSANYSIRGIKLLQA
jgi:hypothetical protein